MCKNALMSGKGITAVSLAPPLPPPLPLPPPPPPPPLLLPSSSSPFLLPLHPGHQNLQHRILFCQQKASLLCYAVIDGDSMKITPLFSNYTLCVDVDLVQLNCSIENSRPLPLLSWSGLGQLENTAFTTQHQAPTGYYEMAYSILTLNISQLGVGTHEFRCNAFVHHSYRGEAYTAYTKASITVMPTPEEALHLCSIDGKSHGCRCHLISW